MKIRRRRFLHLTGCQCSGSRIPRRRAWAGHDYPDQRHRDRRTHTILCQARFGRRGPRPTRKGFPPCAFRWAFHPGEIFVKHPSGDGSEPDVAWQCTFADAAAREADRAARAASAAFENIRAQMRKPLVRFERQVLSISRR
jgi:hypothetical protein